MNLVEESNGKLRLNFHAGQRQMWASHKRFVFMLAGTQAGKTVSGPWWLYREIQAKGPGDYLAVTATYDLFRLKMLPEMMLVYTHYLRAAGWVWRASDRLFTDGTSRIILRSANAPAGLESATVKACWADECGQDEFTREAWEALQRRLSLSEGRVLGTTTLYNQDWLKTDIYDPWREGIRQDVDIIQFPSTLNPSFPLAEYERMKGLMQDWRFSMIYDGRYQLPNNLIYAGVASVIDPFEVPNEWQTVVGVDPSGGHAALVWLAQNPENDVWYVFAENFEHGRTTTENVSQAKELGANRQHLSYVGGSASEEQERRDWQANGIHLQKPSITDLEPGIDRVFGLFKSGKLKVFKNCQQLKDELATYRRKMVNNRVLTEIDKKEQYHLLDALRAAVSQISNPRRIETRRVYADSDAALWERVNA